MAAGKNDVAASVHAVVMRVLCRIGLHRWIVLKVESETYLRCRVRNEVRNKYCGTVTGIGDWVVDKECICCGKKRLRIEQTKERLRSEEQFIWDRIKSA